jgi:hypothetical protein
MCDTFPAECAGDLPLKRTNPRVSQRVPALASSCSNLTILLPESNQIHVSSQQLADAVGHWGSQLFNVMLIARLPFVAARGAGVSGCLSQPHQIPV